jgi:D-psicose/D-tagatose/L-ribulose 3-epimerase
LPIRTLRANFLESLREICPYAAVRGVTVLVEPLNVYEAYPGVLTSISEAISLCEELRPLDVGIQPDFSHMNPSDPAIPDALRTAGKLVRHVHVNETHRYRLGTGHADWRGIMRALKDIQFDGYLAVYMPYSTREATMALGGYEGPKRVSDGGSDPRPDLTDHLEGALNFLKEMERSVELERV